MLNGSWNAYVGKNAAVVTRKATGDRMLGCWEGAAGRRGGRGADDGGAPVETPCATPEGGWTRSGRAIRTRRLRHPRSVGDRSCWPARPGECRQPAPALALALVASLARLARFGGILNSNFSVLGLATAAIVGYLSKVHNRVSLHSRGEIRSFLKYLMLKPSSSLLRSGVA